MLLNDVNGFHIEPTNLCTLKCPGCARTQFINKWPSHWKNRSVNIDSLLKFLDIDLSNKRILLCGNYGDPIYHPHFIDLVKELKQKNAHLKIVTNGSYKTVDWWNKLAQVLDKNDLVSFSIDGMPDNFNTYRINADWETITNGLNVVGSSDIPSEWKFIPFNFNVDDIKEVEELSKSFNIDNFVIEPSDRFDKFTEQFRPTKTNYIGEKIDAKNLIATDSSNFVAINPSCLNNGNTHFISAEGFYTSCCYVSDYRFYYKTIFGKNKKQFNINNNKFSELLFRNDVQDFYNTLDQKMVCKYNCPKT